MPLVLAMGRRLQVSPWTLSVPNYEDRVLSTIPGWHRIPSSSGLVETLSGPWGTWLFESTTVQTVLAQNLQPDVVWTWQVVVSPTSSVLTASQALALAPVIATQLSTVATTLWAQGDIAISLASADARPAVTVQVTNGTAILSVTVNDGATIWQANGVAFGLLPDLPSPVIVRWIDDTP